MSTVVFINFIITIITWVYIIAENPSGWYILGLAIIVPIIQYIIAIIGAHLTN